MTEEQIKDGYDRLDSSLHPPMDALDRVVKRMTLRRRRRWTGTAGQAKQSLVLQDAVR